MENNYLELGNKSLVQDDQPIGLDMNGLGFWKNDVTTLKGNNAYLLGYDEITETALTDFTYDTTIDQSNAKIIYVCNLFTQPGETDDFRVSDHLKLLNSYLGERKIDTVITNSQKVSKKLLKKYMTLEQKDLVEVDDENIKIENVKKPLLKIEDEMIRHDSVKLGLEIMNILAE
jgi:hypothetical protein